ncbi:hypothetical protein E5676_scaffold477G00960 [Cucumis melo var. makuwa]|uniref:Uncharacterized protein n=1 Tax=Cucumis melo var. makuwa TaxID=1194695 RepID=A0A5A7TL01_CUCMM|nr:hypothetical protein E6C27_scaffold795G001090 [Cucumis melo var. makuwa]TYK15505.1 hypothetical protein E5676_scaffold477G00960 [Cucumis melo var. makuwa]
MSPPLAQPVLQALRQGNKSVENYYKKVDTLMDRFNLDEDMVSEWPQQGAC